MSLDTERFLKRGKEERFADGETIYRRGDPSSDGDVFFVVTGSVRLEPHGAPQLSWTVQSGELFGIEEPYAGTRFRNRTATATTDVVVYRWSRRAFDDAMGIYQELATQVIRTLSKGLRELNRALSREGDTP